MKCTERSFAVLCIVLAVPLSLSAGNSMRPFFCPDLSIPADRVADLTE